MAKPWRTDRARIQKAHARYMNRRQSPTLSAYHTLEMIGMLRESLRTRAPRA
jgi:hypothetical protein